MSASTAQLAQEWKTMGFDQEVRFSREMVTKCWYLPGDFIDHCPFTQLLPGSLYDLYAFYGSSLPQRIYGAVNGEITDSYSMDVVLRATLHDWERLGDKHTLYESPQKPLEEIHGEITLTKFLVTPEYALYKLPSVSYRSELDARDYFFKTTDGKTFELIAQKQDFWWEKKYEAQKKKFHCSIEDYLQYYHYEPYLKLWQDNEGQVMAYLPFEKSVCTKTTLADGHEVFVMTPDVPCDRYISILPYDTPVAYM